jgi:peptidoglycan/xylan/chitin deacetylase (PgdA/CDA1 family)
LAPAVDPPGGLMPSQVPQFVMFGSDDNYYADGMNWMVDTAFAGKMNPDGTPAQITFFITAGYGTSQNNGIFIPGSVNQTEQDVVNSWKHAYDMGHEIGNHTWDHDMGMNGPGNSYSVAEWQTEISMSQDFLTNQVGVPACELDTWRFPYLAFDDAGFQAYGSAGFIADTSMEFGYNWWQPPGMTSGFGGSDPESGKHFWWPFTLDNGPPSVSNSGFDPVETKMVGAHPGVWEFLEHTFNGPDPKGDWMMPATVHTITGLDYNLWLAGLPTQGGYDFCNTLKYSFLQKYNGNRTPFNVGVHSPIYSPDDPIQDMDFGNNSDQRRAALQCFIDYLFSGQFPDVRVVGFHKVIEWLRNPTAIH